MSGLKVGHNYDHISIHSLISSIHGIPDNILRDSHIPQVGAPLI